MATSMDNFFTRFETILENQQKVIEAFMEFAKPKNDSTPTHVPVFPKMIDQITPGTYLKVRSINILWLTTW